MPELAQLLSGKSMMRYFPPNGTAGFAIFFVKAPRRLPCPPASIIAKHSVFLIQNPPWIYSARTASPYINTPLLPIVHCQKKMVLCQYTSFINDCNTILFINELRNIYKTNHSHLAFCEKP